MYTYAYLKSLLQGLPFDVGVGLRHQKLLDLVGENVYVGFFKLDHLAGNHRAHLLNDMVGEVVVEGTGDVGLLKGSHLRFLTLILSLPLPLLLLVLDLALVLTLGECRLPVEYSLVQRNVVEVIKDQFVNVLHHVSRHPFSILLKDWWQSGNNEGGETNDPGGHEVLDFDVMILEHHLEVLETFLNRLL